MYASDGLPSGPHLCIAAIAGDGQAQHGIGDQLERVQQHCEC